MTITVNKEALSDDLIVSYDFSNSKSLIGPVLTNLIPSYSGIPYSGNPGVSQVVGSSVEFIPQLGTSLVPYVDVQNNYPAVSNDCCLRPMFIPAFAISPSTQYTYGILYKCDSGYTHPNFMYRYEYTSNGGSYVLEAAAFNTNTKVHLGGGWYYGTATFTTSATTNWFSSGGSFYYQYSTGVDRLYVAKYIIVQGDYTNLHPKYWPDVGTTRSASAALKDLIGTTSISSITSGWDTAGKPYFGGNTGAIDIGASAYTLGLRRYGTFTGWVKPTSYTAAAHVISDYNSAGGTGGVAGNGMALRISSATVAEFYVYPQNHRVSYTGSFPLNTWYHLAGVMDNANIYLYINGVQVGSASLGESIGPSTSTLKIGNRGDANGGGAIGATGWIDTTQIYKRALTPAEILALFNSQRGAYGV